MIRINWNNIKPYGKKAFKAVSFLIIPVILACLFLLTNKCINPFDPVIDKYDNVLVVDGALTNLPGTCFLKLTRTYRLNLYSSDKPYKTENNAEVKIVDDLNNEMILKDNDDGYYLPEDKDFVGMPCRKYKVVIRTISGDVCESSFEELKEPVDMKVYWEFKGNDTVTKGVQIYVDTEDPLKVSYYYLWDYDETWEFEVPYASSSVYATPRKRCYKEMSQKSRILFQSTENYVDDRIIAFPLYFIGDNSNRLFIRYSTLVRQYVLSKKTYEFYRNLKEINEDQGSMFDRVPQSLKGNMINSQDPKQPVLGNFLVSGASTKRIFISRNELPANFFPITEYESCRFRSVLPTLDHDNLLAFDSLRLAGWVVMDTTKVSGPVGATLVYYNMVISKSCYDCTTAGKLEKPSFW